MIAMSVTTDHLRDSIAIAGQRAVCGHSSLSNQGPNQALIRFSIGVVVGIGRSVCVFLFALVWRNGGSLFPETFCKELAKTFRSFAAFCLRLFLLIGSSGHVVFIVAPHRWDRAASTLAASDRVREVRPTSVPRVRDGLVTLR